MADDQTALSLLPPRFAEWFASRGWSLRPHQAGLIEAADSDGAKKLFAITAAGQAELDANKDAVEALIARLAEVGDERQRTDSASVRRAMGNLRAVLMNRLGDRDLDEPTLHAVVALIDEAAQKIERL